jgi:hypothetical protein
MKPQTFAPRAFMLITYLFVYVNLSATEFLYQGFDSGTVAPPGWKIKVAGKYDIAAASGTSIPSLCFGNNGDFIETAEFSGAVEFSFMIKGYKTDSLSSLVIYSYDGISWIRIDSLHHIAGSKKTITEPISLIAKKLRFVYHKSKGSIAFDDLRLRNNEVIPDTVPPVFKEEPKLSFYNDTSVWFKVSINKPGKIYYLITPENCATPDYSTIFNPSKYDSLCLMKSGNIEWTSNTDTILKINGFKAGNKYSAYWLTALNEKTAAHNDYYAINYLFPRTVYDLFFSKIIKGTDNNKAIEIYNPSSDTAFLKNYRIAMSSNGEGWKATYYQFPADSKIAPNDVFVILKTSADTNIVDFSLADDITSSSLLSFTGNDARGLQVTNDNGLTWKFIDIYGYPDSNIVFNVAGVQAAAGKSTVVRKKYIRHGETNWSLSSGIDAKSSQWIVLKQNDFTNLGLHVMAIDTPLFFTEIFMRNQEKLPLIDSLERKINFVLHSESDLKNLILTCNFSPDVSISPEPSTINDFSSPVKFLLEIPGQNISTEWSVFASVDEAPHVSDCYMDSYEEGTIKVMLTEPVVFDSVKPVITLFETSSGQQNALKIDINQDSNIIDITSQTELKKGVSYTLKIDSVSDKYANFMPAYEWSFSVPGTNDIMQVEKAMVQIYPNPSSNYVIIKNDNNYFKNFMQAKIYTTDGKILLSTRFIDLDHAKLDIESLKNGVYVLVLSDDFREIKVYLLKSK